MLSAALGVASADLGERFKAEVLPQATLIAAAGHVVMPRRRWAAAIPSLQSDVV